MWKLLKRGETITNRLNHSNQLEEKEEKSKVLAAAQQVIASSPTICSVFSLFVFCIYAFKNYHKRVWESSTSHSLHPWKVTHALWLNGSTNSTVSTIRQGLLAKAEHATHKQICLSVKLFGFPDLITVLLYKHLGRVDPAWECVSYLDLEARIVLRETRCMLFTLKMR